MQGQLGLHVPEHYLELSPSLYNYHVNISKSEAIKVVTTLCTSFLVLRQVLDHPVPQ